MTKDWSKDDLGKKPVPPIPTFLDMMADKFSEFMTAIGQKDRDVSAKSGLMKLSTDSQPISDKEYLYRLGTLNEIPTRPQGNTAQLSQYLKSQSSVLLGERINGSLPMISQFQQGLSFDLGLSGKNKTGAKKGPAHQRYGLILQGIESEPTMHQRTMHDDSLGDEMVFASQSRLIWTIGPVTEESRQLFHENGATFDRIEESSTWDRFSLPSPDMKMKIAPASTNIQEYIGGKEPAFVLTMTQVENLYQLSYLSRDRDGRAKTSHTFEIPLVGTMSVVKVFDDKGKPLRTEANRILISERAPLVNFRYYNPEQMYVTESVCVVGDHTIKFGAERRFGATTAEHPASRYNTSYSIRF